MEKHNLEGMQGLMEPFFTIVAEFKRKPCARARSPP